MPKYNIAVEIEVVADNPEEAWKLIATPFHDGTVLQSHPSWINPLVGEAELMEEED